MKPSQAYFSQISYLWLNIEEKFVNVVSYSDAMETDDKAGSSPAGKPVETVHSLDCFVL